LGWDFLRVGYQRDSAFGDLNDDGFIDIVVTSLNQRPRILLNSAGNSNPWVMLDLRGRDSNRDAIGAAVKLTTASGRTLYNHVTTTVGFMSSPRSMAWCSKWERPPCPYRRTLPKVSSGEARPTKRDS
jgi:hypothetical protein